MNLFNMHRRLRGLEGRHGAQSPQGYRFGLVGTCTETVELRYFLGSKLVGLAITDIGMTALSAVYTYYDPRLGRRSLGTFSILLQLHLARKYGYRYLYLGFHVEGCPPTAYKAGIADHERLVDGRWLSFARCKQAVFGERCPPERSQA